MTGTDTGWPRFGAFSYGFSSVDHLVEAFGEAGLSAVQWGAELLAEALENPDAAESVRGVLNDGDIAVVGLAGYRNLVAPDDAEREENIHYLDRCLAVAPALGMPVVATQTGTRNPRDWHDSPENRSPAALETLYRSLDALLPLAEAHGSILALECYVNDVIRTADDVGHLLERYPTSALQLVLDPFNFVSSDLLPEAEAVSQRLLDRFEQRWVIAHLKDVSAQGAEVETPAFGDGVFPMVHLKRFLRERRPDLPIVLEHIDFARIPAAIAQFNAVGQDAAGTT